MTATAHRRRLGAGGGAKVNRIPPLVGAIVGFVVGLLLLLLDWTYIVSIVLGGAIAFTVSWHFFQKASADLRQKVEPLAKQTDLVLRGLEEAGIIEFNRDEEGNYIGIVMHVESGPVEIKFSGGGPHTFTRGEK